MVTKKESKMKKCTRCGKRKSRATQFYRDRQKKDGLSCWCKACEKAASAKVTVQKVESSNKAQ